METELTDLELGLQLSTVTTTNSQKAWHIFALLLALGRPARPIELASKCTLFYATPSLVEFLCGIPNSPIYLTPNYLVTLSAKGHLAAIEFVGNSGSKLNFSPPYGFELELGVGMAMPPRMDEEPVKIYFRKRRKLRSEDEYLPAAKKRGIFDNLEEEDRNAVLALPCDTGDPSGKIYTPDGNMSGGIELQSFHSQISPIDAWQQENAILGTSLFDNSSQGLVSCGLGDHESGKTITTLVNASEVGYPYRIQHEFNSLDNDNYQLSMEGPKVSKAVCSRERNFSLLQNSAVSTTAKINDNSSARNINFFATSSMEVDQQMNACQTEASTAIHAYGITSEYLNNAERGEQEPFPNSCCYRGDTGDQPIDTAETDKLSKGKPVESSVDAYNIRVSSIKKEKSRTPLKSQVAMEVDQQMSGCQTEASTAIHAYGITSEYLKNAERGEEEPFPNSCCYRGDTGDQPIDTAETDKLPKGKPVESSVDAYNIRVSSIKKEKSRPPLKSQATLMENAVSFCKNQQPKSSPKPKADQKNAPKQWLQSVGKMLETGNVDYPPVKEQVLKRDKKSILSKNLQYNTNQVRNAKEKKEACNKNREISSTMALDQLDQRVLPDFEGFVAEDQEGSGGYGTVYKAKRKSDGVTFAIKCPHANANRNHVHNELKMLERFGGKNFVIRYEGSFKSGNSDCLVLEHIEHDRPEVLKRDINVSELQWYGYCMFRALAGLHKQGVVHRDVKPGNFLFNRKACKGYLIDFNLALDLTHKHGARRDKTKAVQDAGFNHAPLPNGKYLPSSKNRRFVTAKALEVANQEREKVSRSILESKNMKNETEQSKIHIEVGSRNITKSQGADGSGITSTKDATSTRTPSGEKFREPLPCQGRKELISLVHEALQTATHKAVSVPISKRKRIAAPARQPDSKFMYLTPMPLHSAGVAVAGAGLLKNKGDGKHNREGPCVGTKGFRAPEVLVRSQHQGPKVDIWSAGVTLLYLMIGRTPFAGDPDQNIKEIAKLRGSEDLWEVAKLHNRESSFPADLLDIKSLRSLQLQDWCKQNTRRPELFDLIPRSLFDLVDKCLTVNPRLRISAEEALRHEFFSPCHEALRKHRLLKRVSLDFGSNLALHGQSQTCDEEVS